VEPATLAGLAAAVAGMFVGYKLGAAVVRADWRAYLDYVPVECETPLAKKYLRRQGLLPGDDL